MYFVIFNGPPRCGKDTASRMLVAHMDSYITTPVMEESLSMPMRYSMFGLLGLTYSDEFYESLKPTTIPALNVTGRQHMIDISEKFLKPVYGQNVMARLLIDRVHDFPGLVLVRDGGFQNEVEALIDFVGEENVFVVRVKRIGTTFDGDSRHWVNHPNPDMQMDLLNHGDLDSLQREIESLYLYLVEELGWAL